MKLEYRATPPSLGSGNNNVSPQCDSVGNLKNTLATIIEGEDQSNHIMAVMHKLVANSTYTPSRFTDFGANATLNVKASAGIVMSVICTNTNAATRYLQIHDTATTPGGGAVPIIPGIPIATGTQVRVGKDIFSEAGFYCANGIAFAFSTTQNTYTAGAAGDQSTCVFYK